MYNMPLVVQQFLFMTFNDQSDKEKENKTLPTREEIPG